MKILLVLVLTFYLSLAQTQTYVQINGISLHDQPGFNGRNWGAGLEQGITDHWTVAGGWYYNSDIVAPLMSTVGMLSTKKMHGTLVLL